MNFTRDLNISDPVGDAESTLVLSFASSEPYYRENKKFGEYNEVLEITEEAIDFTRLVDNRAPLLLNHDTERQIGVVERAWIEYDKLYCEVKFSDSNFAQQILNDVKAGIRRNTSIGYEILDYQMLAGTPPIMIAKKWIPYEVSIAPIPADPTVGYNRSLENKEDEDMEEEKDKKEEQVEENEETSKKSCEETSEETTEANDKTKAEETVEEKACGEDDDEDEEKKKAADIEEIRSLGELMDCKELAEQFIKENKNYTAFKEAVREYKNNKLNVKKKDIKEMADKFSLRKALLNATGKMSDDEAAFERGIIEENKRKFNVTDADIVLSKKELRAFDGTEALNQTVYQPGMYTPNLRPAVTVDAIGTKKVAVSGPSISFSVATSGINAGFVDINGNVPSATMDFELKTMTPKKQGAYVDISYQALLQDDPSAEGIIMDDIVKALDQSKNVAFFNGLSGNNEPVGILNVAGVNEVTIPATPKLSTALEFEKKIRDSYDYSPNLKWVMGTGAYYKWASTPYSAAEQNKMLVDPDTRKCIGYDVYVDASMPASGVILGNFDEALEADFDGITIRVVEDAGLARKQALEIVAHRAIDFLCRRPRSFTKGV